MIFLLNHLKKVSLWALVKTVSLIVLLKEYALMNSDTQNQPPHDEDVDDQLDERQQAILAKAQKSFNLRMTLNEIIRSLPASKIQRGLIITADTAVLSFFLNRRSDVWDTVILHKEYLDEARQLEGERVHVYDHNSETLPFDDSAFDVVIVIGGLERVESDQNLIMQCHRTLKPDGRFVVNTAHVKAWGFIPSVRNMLGLTPDRVGLTRAGYSETELFTTLKDGFDVHSVSTHSRFFVQFVHALAQSSILKRLPPEQPFPAFHNKLYALFSPAYYLDLLLFFTRGYRLTAAAKRRAWRPRRTPSLNDGRTLPEAVLSERL